MLEAVAIPSHHVVYFDNYFNSHALLKTLRSQDQRATGTIRDNRTRKCPLSNVKIFKKKKRGYYKHLYDSESALLFVRWQDNSTVTMGTNFDKLLPIGRLKRWSAVAKRKIDVPQPHIFHNQKKFMSGVDLHDSTVNNYRITIRGKKWWWVLITNMINMAIANTWRLYQLSSKDS